MNTRPVIDESAGPVSLSVAFNSDSSCFSVGLDTGFCGKLRRNSFHQCVSLKQLLTKDKQFSAPIHVSSRCHEVRNNQSHCKVIWKHSKAVLK